MNKEILMVVDAVSNEKGVDKEIIFEALEAALASATRKKSRRGHRRARRDQPQDRRLRHVPPLEGVRRRFHRARIPGAASCGSRTRSTSIRTREPGGFVEVPMESVAFGRIAAQTAKQVIVQKVREAERAQVVDEYQGRVGTLVSRHRQARRSQRHLRRPRRQCRRLHPARPDDPARAGAHAGPHQGLPARTCAPSRAARSCS